MNVGNRPIRAVFGVSVHAHFALQGGKNAKYPKVRKQLNYMIINVKMRGGPGRIRTCDNAVMSGAF